MTTLGIDEDKKSIEEEKNNMKTNVYKKIALIVIIS